MSDFPDTLKYAATHEWVREESADVLVIGISDHAQEALGDVVYVELPGMDVTVEAGGEIAVVESVKAASDIYAPVAGQVVAVNNLLEEAPETVNGDPYGDGWFFKLRADNPDDVSGLLRADEYKKLCEADEQ